MTYKDTLNFLAPNLFSFALRGCISPPSPHKKRKKLPDIRSVNFERDFDVFDFLQKTNEGIRLDYYDTSNPFVFVRFLEEIEDTKKNISKLSDL